METLRRLRGSDTSPRGSPTAQGGGGGTSTSVRGAPTVTTVQAPSSAATPRRNQKGETEWRVAICACHRRQTSPDHWTLYFEVAVESDEYTWTVLKSDRQFEDLQTLLLTKTGNKSVRRKLGCGASSYLQAFEVVDPFFVETRRRTYERLLVAFVHFAWTKSVSSADADVLWSFLDPSYEKAPSFLDTYQKEGPTLYYKAGRWKPMWIYLKNGFLCLSKLQGDKKCRKYIPVHHSVLTPAEPQESRFGLYLTTGTYLQKCYRLSFNTFAERKSWMLAIFEVQARFFEFNPFREPAGDEDESDSGTSPSFPALTSPRGVSDPFASRSSPNLASHSSPVQSVSSSPVTAYATLRHASPPASSSSLASSAVFTSKSTPILSLSGAQSSAPSSPSKRPTAIYQASTPIPLADLSSGSPSSSSSSSTSSRAGIRTNTVKTVSQSISHRVPSATVHAQNPTDRIIPSVNRSAPTSHSTAGESKSAKLIGGAGASGQAARRASGQNQAPQTNASSLVHKHPSQRFTPEEMRVLWDTLDQEKDVLYDVRSQDSRFLEGKLKMQGKKLKRWKEYVFRLEKGGIVTYNPPSGPTKEKRRIVLKGASVIEADAEGLYSWCVVTPARNYIIGAEMEATKMEWMRVMQDTINEALFEEREGLLQRNARQDEVMAGSPRSSTADYPKAAGSDGQKIKAATVEALLKHLFSPECDMIFFKTFLLTYRSFTKPDSFFETIKHCFATGEVELSPETKKPSTSAASSETKSPGKSSLSASSNGVSVRNNLAGQRRSATSKGSLATSAPAKRSDKMLAMQQRVCIVLKQWIAVGYVDFSVKMKSAIMMFVESQLASDFLLAKESQELRAVLRFQMGNEAARTLPFAVIQGPVQEQLVDMSTEVVAQHLTLLQFEYFRRIRAHEFLNQAWNKPPMKNICANLIAAIDHFNELSAWVVHTILSEPNLADRARLLSKMINIAELLLKYNNFCGVMAFVAALHSAAVSRLKRTWEKISSSQRKVVDRITELFSPSQSFKSYRMAIRSASRPGCPYLGTFLGDLVYLEEINPDTIMNGTRELVNFAKRRAIYEVISQVLYFRDEPYTFKAEPAIGNVLLSMIRSPDIIVDGERLSEISRQIEPKASH